MTGHKTGGPDRSPTYVSWQSMIARCLKPRSTNYYKYGARGVSVCDRWRKFENFVDDMGERPGGKTIDRIDGSRGYEPGNCRWATAVEQNTNRKTARKITIGNETHTVAEWARRAGLSEFCLFRRIKNGESGEALLRKPSKGWRAA